jgi:serine/threonine protein kinase
MGVVLYIMLSGKVPFPGHTEPEIIYNVIKAEFHFDYEAFQNVTEECKDLIKNCLVREYEQRFTAKQAIEHIWIQK